jgi:hypothetical protein
MRLRRVHCLSATPVHPYLPFAAPVGARRSSNTRETHAPIVGLDVAAGSANARGDDVECGVSRVRTVVTHN